MVMILDGGMGQELIARADKAATRLWGTQVMIDEPHLVREIHDEYFAAGAEIATANTYSAHRDRLDPRGKGHMFEELHRLACRMAAEARDAHGSGLVAGSAGPLGFTYVGDAGPDYDVARGLFSEIADLHAPFVDVLLAESVPSVARARATIDGLDGHGKPVWVALTVDDTDGTRLRSGEPVTDILPLLSDRDVEALLINCSIPEAVTQALESLAGVDLPLGAYANGFREITREYLEPEATVEVLEAREDLTPSAYAGFAETWAALGATIIGGCCEVGPDHIAELTSRLKPGTRAVDSRPSHA